MPPSLTQCDRLALPGSPTRRRRREDPQPSADLWRQLAAIPDDSGDDDWLGACLLRNAGTEYLRQFGSPQDVERFRERVPLVDYEDLLPWIEALTRGRSDVLFAGRPVAYERTAGSTGGGKLVPYSREGLEDFRRALVPWLAGCARRFGVTGRVYLSLSPATRAPEQIGEVPVGLGDGAYLGPLAGRLLAGLSVVPLELADLTDVARWRSETLLRLRRADDLELISCWSPTFLLRLLDELADPVASWPRLKLVSCWAAAASQAYAEALAARLPQAHLQPKGLMSTESVVTVPGLDGRPVLTRHGFFEFQDAGRVLLADELRAGGIYSVIVTTASGLYRYRTGDRVRCSGFRGAHPVLEFVGRDGLGSDLVGEKLTETFVAACLSDVHGFCMLAPAADRAGYVLASEAGTPADVEHVEHRLCANPQYLHARRLGQLQPLRLVVVDGLFDRYVAAQLDSGTRLGDVKPIALRSEPGWLARLGVSS